MHRHVLQLQVNRQAEEQAEGAEDQADREQLVPIHSQEADRGEIGKLQIGFATGGLARLSEGGGSLQQKECQRAR